MINATGGEADLTEQRPVAPKVEWVPIGQLRPNPKNPRRISAAQLESLCRSIEQDPGFMTIRPLIATADGVIVGGNQRLAAVKRLKWTEVPVVRLAMDDQLAATRAIRDNGSWGEWDEQELGDLLSELESRGTDVGSLGFDHADLERILAQVDATGPSDDDDFDPTPPLEPETRPGDVYRLGPHVLACGSSTDAQTWARLFTALGLFDPTAAPDDREPQQRGLLAAALWTDPPYGVRLQVEPGQAFGGDASPAEATALLAAVLPHADRYLCPGAPWYITGPSGVAGIGFLSAIKASGWDLRQNLVWIKNAFVLGHADYHHQHELIYYGSTAGASRRWLGGRDKSTLIDDRPDYAHLKHKDLVALLRQRDNERNSDVIAIDKTAHNDLHPTMKPPALIRHLLANSTARGDLVLDPFAGSGSTMVACEQLGRRAALVEFEPKFCDVIVRRWRELAPGNPVTRIRDGVAEVLL